MDRDEIQFDATDAGLRDDVNLLGGLVGDVIKEQCGEELYRLVESIRHTAIARRAASTEDLWRQLSSLPPFEAREVIRAFSTYFQVVNLAERVHRIRRRRDYERDPDLVQAESLEDALLRLNEAGVPVEGVGRLLAELHLEPVFTAHPTEATRRTLLVKQQRIARKLVDRIVSNCTPYEERRAVDAIRDEITTAWQTDEHPAARISVNDERDQVIFYLTNVIYQVVPEIYETLRYQLQKTYGTEADSTELPAFLSFASWVGGDMDGNPNVTADTLKETLAKQRKQVLRRYRDDVHRLHILLSHSLSRVRVGDDVTKLLRTYAAEFPVVMESTPQRHRNMPYRQLLRLIGARINATEQEEPNGYGDAGEFIDDLQKIAASLQTNRGAHAGLAHVRRLLRRVDTFGFHFATVDVRQDALVHRRVVGKLLGEGAWMQRSAEQRAERILGALHYGEPQALAGDDEAHKCLAVFQAIRECREKYGASAIQNYIISMAHGIDDVLSVLLLARWAGCVDHRGGVPVNIVPLFETVADLDHAPAVMDMLLSNDYYLAHLDTRERRQMVMLGYSDSSKDAGLAASRWSLRKAERQLSASAKQRNITLALFHGRGGTVSRGGDKTHKAVLAAPAGTMNGRLRFTEQGEIIDAKYGLRGIATRTLERLTAAALLAHQQSGETAEPVDVMEALAEQGRQTYRELIYDNPEFERFFRQFTPIDVIERMQIGSRPVARRGQTGITNLRAIPWVFSWTQTRLLLPGWYGVGSGLYAATEQFGTDALRELINTWPFFSNFMADVEMVLAKSDLEIAARYADLIDTDLKYIFDKVLEEHKRLTQLILDLKNIDALLDDDPVLQRSIKLRNPYVDPLSMLQVSLLQRWRQTDKQDEELLHALFATVNGIARGLQNTG
ncbi:MAG: phosphoenolpyruvate carboxylase [Gammaproteobacteria bacterium]|nr:phosphoenolpyruvate carboxylase [Gammaproteobacteria bacterium]